MKSNKPAVRRGPRTALVFKSFSVVIRESETEKFLEALERVCERFAGTVWSYNFQAEDP